LGDVGTRRETGVAGLPGEAHVPGTDVLADVATEYPFTQLRSLRLAEGTTVLDRQIRNARARVEIARAHEGLRRTGVQTAPAGAGAVRVERKIGLEVGVGQHHADEREGTDLGVDEHHVLADPAESRELRELALGYRAGIDVTARLGAGGQEP